MILDDIDVLGKEPLVEKTEYQLLEKLRQVSRENFNIYLISSSSSYIDKIKKRTPIMKSSPKFFFIQPKKAEEMKNSI